ncbi:(2Fe-2S)-binding protein [Pseudonocardia hierapolitana]|uniref:(2Fe-2S)-binding protein n=1 Tax=Pseudonocardia hierapolitana TaxID=1128676 RepID=UPI001FE2AE75|nr:(2Fe-2S)-binding protein [Pseudonocardia hierapolitana]
MCICYAVPDAVIRSCVANGARTVEEVGDACDAGTGCGSCHDHIDVFLAAAHAPSEIAGLARSA